MYLACETYQMEKELDVVDAPTTPSANNVDSHDIWTTVLCEALTDSML